MKNPLRQGVNVLRDRLPAWRPWALVGGAIGFGLLAVLGANAYIQERVELERSRLAGAHERIEVLVARRPLQKGETLGPETLAVRALPRSVLPGGAMPPARIDAIQGLKLQWPLQAGEPVLASAVAAAESQGLSSRLRAGGRAMTIAVDETNAISGLLQPGDRIDLLLSWRPAAAGGLTQPEITRSVMQDVTVIATGRHARATSPEEGSGRAFSAITVEVDPEQAQRLVVAQRSGRLTAILRNPEDREAIEVRALDVHDLMGAARPPSGGLAALIQTSSWPPASRATPEGRSGRDGSSSSGERASAPGSSSARGPVSTAEVSAVQAVSPEFKVELIVGGRGPIAGPGEGPWAMPERSPPPAPAARAKLTAESAIDATPAPPSSTSPPASASQGVPPAGLAPAASVPLFR